MYKTKGLIYGMLIFCIAMFAFLLVCNGQTYVIELSEDNIGYIVVRNAGTGEIREYSDRNDIHDIISYFNGVVLKGGHNVDHRGNGGDLYWVRFFSSDGSEVVFRVTISDMDHIQIITNTKHQIEFPFDAREIVALFAQ